MILYGCATVSSPASPVPATESTVNEKIDRLVGQLTQETALFAGKVFAVTEFTDASDKKTALTAYLTDLLIDRLSRSGKIHLVERSRLDTVMNELDFSMTGYIEERSEKLLGRLVGADGIANGKVIDLGDTLDVKVRLIQTETGKIIATAQVELVNDRKMQRLAGQVYEKPELDFIDPFKIQGLDQLKQATELVAKEDWQGLQKLAEQWTVSEPGNSYSWFNLGYAYKKLKQYDLAVGASQEALRIEPNDPWTWANLGQAYNNLKQYDKAATAYQGAVRIKPDYAVAWYNLGNVYRDLKQYDKAVTALQEAVRIEPKDVEVWDALGNAYTLNQQDAKAIAAYQEAVRIKPDYAMAWMNMGITYRDLKQYDKAVTALQEAVRIEPTAAAWERLGTSYYNLEQYDKAVTALQEALRIDPDDAYAWENLGGVYLNQGRYGKFYKAYQALRKLDALEADEFFKDVLKERWLRYSTSGGGSGYFFDYKNITHVSNGVVGVWTKVDINKNDKYYIEMREARKKKESIESATEYTEINCVESKYRTLSSVWYGKEGILERHNYDDPPWDIVPPETNKENLKNAACD